MITFRGVVLVATAIFIFVLARLTQVGWLYLLDATFWGAILLSFAAPWLVVTSLSVRRRLVRREGSSSSLGPSEGEAVNLEVQLENGRFWPRFLLSVGYHSPLAGPGETWQRCFVSHLRSGSSIPMVSSVRCYRRGLHQFGPVYLESKTPFGLFRRRKRLESPLSVLVYPQVHTLNQLPLMEGMQGTAVRPRRTRVGQEIAGTRHYFPGDPLRNIHWRNTARLGVLMVKEFEDTQDNTLVIVFDLSQELGEGKETTVEYSIKLAASVAGYVMAQGGKVHLSTGNLPSQEMPWNLMLKELALLKVGHGPGLSSLVDSIPAGSKVLALVNNTDIMGIEALSRRAAQMSGQAVVLLEGFADTPTQRTLRAFETLKMSGSSVISCEKGGFIHTLRSLESMVWFSHQNAQATPARNRFSAESETDARV